jgi:predicted nucleic acid-binding Zn ribbon protein
MVPADELAQSATSLDDEEPERAQATPRPYDADDWLREERDEALAEADYWRRLVEEERVARVKAEAELAAERRVAATLEAQLAEARKPWLAKVLEGLRRKG